MAQDRNGNLAGKQLGAYQLVELLGEGGMAEVYLARDLNLGRRVAIKILPRILAADPGYVRRFREEARRVASLQHPHIIPIYFAGEEDGLLYMVMPVVQESLRGRIARGGSPTPEQAISLVSQIAEALAAAHQIGLVHRDVKPENILIDAEGNAMLTDFGIAREVHRPSTDGKHTMQTISASGLPVGTPEYMAPEQLLGGSVGPQADIYALGVVLYELLTGHLPREAANPMEVAALTITRRPFAPPMERNSRVWPTLNRVVMTALEYEPRDRFEDMGRFHYALEQSLRYRDEPSRPEHRRTTASLGEPDTIPPGGYGHESSRSLPLDDAYAGSHGPAPETMGRPAGTSRPREASRPLEATQKYHATTARPARESRPVDETPATWPLREGRPGSRPLTLSSRLLANVPTVPEARGGAGGFSVSRLWEASYRYARRPQGGRRYWWMGLAALLLLGIAGLSLGGFLHGQQAAITFPSGTAGKTGGTATNGNANGSPTAHGGGVIPLQTHVAATKTAFAATETASRPPATATSVPTLAPTPVAALLTLNLNSGNTAKMSAPSNGACSTTVIIRNPNSSRYGSIGWNWTVGVTYNIANNQHTTNGNVWGWTYTIDSTTPFRNADPADISPGIAPKSSAKVTILYQQGTGMPTCYKLGTIPVTMSDTNNNTYTFEIQQSSYY